jgi:uncharacterized membrane-anchored protein
VGSPPERGRISLLLVAAVFCVVCFALPRFAYAVRLELLELRYFGLFLAVIALFIWVLVKIGPGDRR